MIQNTLQKNWATVPKKATAVDWLIVGKAEEGKGYLLAGFTKLFSRDNKDRQ